MNHTLTRPLYFLGAVACWLLLCGLTMEKIAFDEATSTVLLIAVPAFVLAGGVLFHHAFSLMFTWSFPRALVAFTLGCICLSVTLPFAIDNVGSVSARQVEKAEAANTPRRVLENTLREAKATLKDAQASFAQECGSGKGKRCEGQLAILSTHQTRVDSLTGRLATLPPDERALVGESNISDLASLAGLTFTPTQVQQYRAISVAVLLELLFIYFWSYSFSASNPLTVVDLRKEEPRPQDLVDSSSPLPSNVVQPNFSSRRLQVHNWIAEFEDTHGRKPNPFEVKAAFPAMPRASADRYLREYRAA